MKKAEVHVASCSDEVNDVGQTYAGIVQLGYEVDHVFSTYQRGRGAKVLMIGVRISDAADETPNAPASEVKK